MNTLIEVRKRVTMMFKRVFLIVLDSLGIGSTLDAYKYDDEGANTLLHTIGDKYNLDVLEKLGLTSLVGKEEEKIVSLYMRANPMSSAKDSLNGHYELIGAIPKTPYKVYKEGFHLN